MRQIAIDPETFKERYYKYVFDFTFSYETLEFCRFIKNKLGWQKFCFHKNQWRFNDPAIVQLIWDRYPEMELTKDIQADFNEYKLGLEQEKLKLAKLEELKKSTDSNTKISGLKLKLYPYQKVGVDFFITNEGKAILADTMGLGKTAQALAYVVHKKMAKTLVVCPASVKYSWENEVKKWTKLKPFVFDSVFLRTKEDIDVIDKHDIFIINYDILETFMKTYKDIRWDCLIGDEFHYIKNTRAKRTLLFKKLSRRIPSILLLSGTPFLSRPVELFSGLNIMDPENWADYWHFTKRYCAGHQGQWGWDVQGHSNIEELQSKIGRYFLRRNKDEVLPDLPPKRFIDFPVELDSETKFEYDLALNSFIEYLKDIKEKTDIEIKKSMAAQKLVKLGALRQITTLGKIEAAKELIENLTDNGEKVVVFSCYNEPLDKLQDYFGASAVTVIGKTQDSFRPKLIEAFQKNSKVKIFLGGIKSAGVGITLTAGANVVFLDYSWVPSDHSQAADRIHRIGQKADSVSIYHMYARNTIDAHIRQVLEEKQALFDKIIENNELAPQKSMNLVEDLIGILAKDTQEDELST